MAAKEFVLSQEGAAKLKAELELLKTERRREVAARIKEAIEYGDLAENDEYRVAREEQAFVEGRILELETILRHARILENGGAKGAVSLGSRVFVSASGNKAEYEIVGANESDPGNGKISADSPIGRALMGHQAGEKVAVETPAGSLEYKIIKVE